MKGAWQKANFIFLYNYVKVNEFDGIFDKLIVCISNLKKYPFKTRLLYKRQAKFTYGAQEMAQKLLQMMQC